MDVLHVECITSLSVQILIKHFEEMCQVVYTPTGNFITQVHRRLLVVSTTTAYPVLLPCCTAPLTHTHIAPAVAAVGWACSNYHKLYRRPRGMFFSAQDKGEMVSLLARQLQRSLAGSSHVCTDLCAMYEIMPALQHRMLQLHPPAA